VALGGPVRDQGTVFLSLAVRGKASLDLYDLTSVRATGSSVWGLLPVEAWPPHSFPFDAGMSEQRGLMDMAVFPPRWVRSFDLRLSVPEWPAQPAASFKLTIVDEKVTAVPAGQRNLPFTVPEARWTTSRQESPARRCVRAVIDTTGWPSAGHQQLYPRFTDERGRLLRAVCGSGGLAGGRWTEEWEVFPQGRPRAITLDIFTQEQMEATRLVFEFRKLPNPADRGRR
jgi:hypothetical protein